MEDATPPNLNSDAGISGSVHDSGDLRSLVKALTERVTVLEETIAHMANPQVKSLLRGPLVGEADISGETIAPSSLAAPPPLVASTRFKEDVAEAPKNRERSLEDRLGSQVFNRIGIIAILIGVTWFLKLAMDNHWIGPLGRVLTGLVAGAGIVLWSERFRRQEVAAFSYSLKAIGTGVLYLSLWASFQIYQLVTPGVAFALMLLVTLWNAWMAWSQQSEILAAYAVSGAFATPALLSTGRNDQVFLFSYLLTIDVATIVLVRFAASRSKSWSRLLIAVLSATILYFIEWYSRFYTADQLLSTSIFIALFFASFFTVAFRIDSKATVETVRGEPSSDVLVPIANAVFASLAFYSVLEDSGNHASLPWVALLFAAIYLAAMRLPLLDRMQTAAARAVHLSLAVLFLTVAIPLKASGRWIVLGWLAEGVALLWAAARLHADTGISVQRTLRQLASLALLLALFGLLVTPYWLDRTTHVAILNQRFATELAGIFGFAVAAWIAAAASASNAPNQPRISPSWMKLAAASAVAFNLIALQAGIIEIQTFWAQGRPGSLTSEVGLQTALSISAFLMIYGTGLLAAGFWRQNAFLRWQGLGLLVIAIVKTFLYDVRSLSQGYRVASFLGLGALLMAVSFVYVRRDGKASLGKRE